MADLLLHQVLGHYCVADPAGPSYGKDETQGRVQGADCCQVFKYIGYTHSQTMAKQQILYVEFISYSTGSKDGGLGNDEIPYFVVTDSSGVLAIIVCPMWLGFDQAQGWQMISTQYSSQDTSVSILQMYSLSPTILPNKLYAFKIMTLSKPTSIVSTKSIHKISLKSKDMGKIKAEIKALQRLREYACIIELYQVLGHNEENRVFFHQFMKKQRKNIALILQYCPNRTLYHYVRQSSLEEKSIVCICLQIWEIIKALRECQILHRDLRSVNLMMSNQGLKLIDFDCCFIKGYSQVNDLSFPFVQEVTAPQILTLLRDFDPDDQISSEQLYKSQQKCDLYAFGAIIYEMINKTSYERGKITQSTSQIFSRELITLMRELLNQNPEQRIRLQSIGHILTILAQKHQIHFIPMNKRQIHNSYTPFQGIQCDNSLSLQSSSSSSLSDWSFSSKSTLDKGAHTPTPTLSPTLDDSFY